MSLFTAAMNAVATYWAPTGSYGVYGDPVFAAPVVLDPATNNGVRFESKVVKFQNMRGDEDLGHSIVYSTQTAFAIGGYLYLGTSVVTNPEAVSGAFRILHVDSSSELRSSGTTLYKAIL
jgi:hypothetical protein